MALRQDDARNWELRVSDNTIIFSFLPALFVFMLLLVEVGRRLGIRNVREETEHERAGLMAVGAAIYGLLGLLVAFTFSGAATRFDVRRTLTVQEANAIGTAYLRLDLLPTNAQPDLRDKFRRYTEARLAVYQALPDIDASSAHATRAAKLQREIWSNAVAALREAPASATMLLLPALNDMIDITTTRSIATLTHTPPLILGALAVLAMFCSVLAGHGLAGGKRSSMILHMVGFALVVTATIYVILDLDYPRVGLISLDYVDRAFHELLAGMK